MLREASSVQVPAGAQGWFARYTQPNYEWSYDAHTKLTGVDHDIAVPFRIRTAGGLLSFFSMTTVFGTPVDVMLAELALELFFPADDDTAVAVQRMAATHTAQ